jgi:hypothetical protein
MISWLYFLTTCIVSSKFIYISSWVEMLFSLLYCYLSRLFELSEESRAYQLINGWKGNGWTIAKFEIYFFICNKIVLHDVLFCLFLKQYFNIFTFNLTFKVVIYINIHIYTDDDNTEMMVFLIYLSLIEWGGLADMLCLWTESLDSDGQQISTKQTSTSHLNSFNIKKTTTYDVGNPGPG